MNIPSRELTEFRDKCAVAYMHARVSAGWKPRSHEDFELLASDALFAAEAMLEERSNLTNPDEREE